jgi:hypothetical protein
VLVAQSLILTEQIPNFTRAYADIPRRNVRIRADVTVKLVHKALAERHNFSI